MIFCSSNTHGCLGCLISNPDFQFQQPHTFCSPQSPTSLIVFTKYNPHNLTSTTHPHTHKPMQTDILFVPYGQQRKDSTLNRLMLQAAPPPPFLSQIFGLFSSPMLCTSSPILSVLMTAFSSTSTRLEAATRTICTDTTLTHSLSLSLSLAKVLLDLALKLGCPSGRASLIEGSCYSSLNPKEVHVGGLQSHAAFLVTRALSRTRMQPSLVS